MKVLYPICLALLIGGSVWMIEGCSTEQPGAAYALGAYSANVDGTPDRVTSAAQKAAEDMKFKDIVANQTKIDGHLTAADASGDTVSIDVQQAGDNVSKVTIRVGSGDEAVSRQILDKLEGHLSWFSSL
ncbi:MAG TPA: DUF3568 family protein [Tepidisphaeraceae bacterium]|nr:DUF3568 family protein [Tepidisphaeraceae bacterium]